MYIPTLQNNIKLMERVTDASCWHLLLENPTRNKGNVNVKTKKNIS